MEHLLHLLACRFPLVLVIFVNRNPATAAISEPDPLELLRNFGAFLSGINDIFVRFYSRLLYFHLLDLLHLFGKSPSQTRTNHLQRVQPKQAIML